MRQLEITPWTYEDYLEATNRSDNALNRKRWLDVISEVRVKFKKHMDAELWSCIKEVDEDL